MKRASKYLSTVIALCVCNLLMGIAVASVPSPDGSSKTLLSDGRLLITGGLEAGKATALAYIVDSHGSTASVGPMLSARASHSATVLPDGDVLVFGGLGARGEYVRTMELFHPNSGQFTVWSGSLLVPRAGHTATVMTDGRVVIMGGTSEGGAVPPDIQILDSSTGGISTIERTLAYPRTGHSATLLADGTIVIAGGQDPYGKPVPYPESFSPATTSFQILNTPYTTPNDAEAPFAMAAAVPSDGATQFPVTSFLKLRFSRIIDVRTASTATLSLTTADGAVVSETVAAAENGRLAFVSPTSTLEPSTSYTLAISGIADLAGNILPDSTIRFTTSPTTNGDPNDSWIPDANALSGNWNSKSGASDWQHLPSLKAPEGATALAGQVLGISGSPLRRVTLSIGNQQAETDASGRFLLKGLQAGHGVLLIDGATANRGNVQYGQFEVGVTIKAGKTTALNYTIWMTQLDTAHTVHIPSPTTAQDTVITSPLLPGLELHLPKGTTIVSRMGKPVKDLTITAIPLDKPPFPLPTGLRVPLYFTIQPGLSEIRSPGIGTKTTGAQLFYPNSFSEPAGTIYNFWNYDAVSRGWYIYGNGYVEPNKIQIKPDAGVFVYELTGAMVGGGSAKNGIGAGGPGDGDPVSLASGEYSYSKTDLALPDVIPLSLTRTYTTNDHYQRPFGIGTTDNYDMFMVGDKFPYTYQELILPNGTAVRFNRTSPGTLYTDAVYQSTSMSGYWYGATLYWNPSPGTPVPGAAWLLRTRNGTLYAFPDASSQNAQVTQAVLAIQDRNGNTVSLTRDSNSNLTTITSPFGRSIALAYDSQSRIISATDNTGRSVGYAYDSGGHLSTVTDVNGGVTTYAYNGSDQITSITDQRGITYLQNQYDSFGRVLTQTDASGGVYQFQWTPSSNSSQQWVSSGPSINPTDPTAYQGYTGLISQVSVTDPRGYVHQVGFNNLGLAVNDTHALGQPEQQSSSTAYFANNLPQSHVDALGRTTTFGYDGSGNLTSITKLAGMAGATTSTYTYDPALSTLLTATDPLGHTTSMSYDSNGNLTQVLNGLGKGMTFAYANGAGLPSSLTDAVGNTTVFSYTGADVTGTTDALGNQSLALRDSAGRTVASTDPLGNVTRYTFDSANQLKAITNSQGDTASFSYDGDGNMLSLSDFQGHVTTYTYDSMNRPVTRTDPLHAISSVVYDLGGDPVARTDRNGHVVATTFDGLSRPTLVGYAATSTGGSTSYESTIQLRYDSGNRLQSAADSASGSISYTYDSLDRLTTEASTAGSVTYTYDAAGRRATAQSSYGPLTQYTWDTVNRLTGLVQGTYQVGFTYDAASRRTSLALPNGITVQYGYDADSRLNQLTYNSATSALGSIAYTFDNGGRLVGKQGSFAHTNFPLALGTATYDAGNRLLSWDGVAPSYDSEGNTINDGSGNQYAWNSRGQLVSIAGGVTATFGYDVSGRRLSKTLAGQSTSYFYDGTNRIAETTNNQTATLLPGGTDEYYLRLDGAIPTVPLSDALGSTIATTDGEGGSLASFWYAPFGQTTVTGSPTADTTQYTGRENDGDGLYYYRARYYNPLIGRFISQDPLGFAGQSFNLYRYAGNSPTMLRDPDGRCPQCFGAFIGGAAGFGAYAFTHRKDFTWGGAAAWAGAGALTGAGLGEFAEAAGMFGEGAGALDGAAGIGGGEGPPDLCCLAAGTLVHTKNGYLAIENVHVGTLVLSHNRDSGKTEYKPVVAVIQPHADTVVAVQIAGDHQTLFPSSRHPFFVRSSSSQPGDWLQASLLRTGSQLLTTRGRWVRVVGITSLKEPRTVYNIEVADNHDFYIARKGYLVHNSGPCDIARQAAQGFGNKQCTLCAKAMAKALEEAGYSNGIDFVQQSLFDNPGLTSSGGPMFNSNNMAEAISDNGFHTGINVGGTVFDNITPNGLPFSQWLNSFATLSGGLFGNPPLP